MIATGYNLKKAAVLTLLDYRSFSGSPYMSAGEISLALRLSPRERESLYILLGRWTDWRLVVRARGTDKRAVYVYRLSGRGRNWLSYRQDRTEARAGLPLGYLGDTVAVLAGVAVWWVAFGHLFYTIAPFSGPDRLWRSEKEITLHGSHVILKADDGIHAYVTILEQLHLGVDTGLKAAMFATAN